MWLWALTTMVTCQITISLHKMSWYGHKPHTSCKQTVEMDKISFDEILWK
jgi:hypothetical protein